MALCVLHMDNTKLTSITILNYLVSEIMTSLNPMEVVVLQIHVNAEFEIKILKQILISFWKIYTDKYNDCVIIKYDVISKRHIYLFSYIFVCIHEY